METKRAAHIPARNQRLSDDSYQGSPNPIFITIRAEQGSPFLDNRELCLVTIRLLREMRVQYGCWVSAYCLMPDHLHYVAGAETDGSDVRLFTNRFKGRSTNTSWKYGWTGSLWQKRFHDHVVRVGEELDNVEAYVLDNPRRAGLISDPGEWEWSGVFDPSG